MYKPMKIFTVYSRRVDVLLYILQNMIFRIRGNVITFLRTLWIWHWLSFGQDRTVVGAPWTTHTASCPKHILASAHLPIKCGKRVVPTVTTSHPLDQYCSADGPGWKASICSEERQRVSFKLMRTNLTLKFLADAGSRTKVCVSQKRNQL